MRNCVNNILYYYPRGPQRPSDRLLARDSI